jgi:hypothetical protein
MSKRRPAGRGIRGVPALLFCGAALGLHGCNSGLSQAEYSVVEGWLSCSDCLGGEQAAVEALGAPATPVLAGFLEGIPLDRENTERARLRGMYRASPLSTMSENQYVDTGYESWRTRVQSRSAISLADLGEYDALRDAFRNRGTRGYAPATVRALQQGLAAQSLTGVAQGSVIDGVAGVSGVTITLIPCELAPAFTGDSAPGECIVAGAGGVATVTDATGTWTAPLPEGIWQTVLAPPSVGLVPTPSSQLFAVVANSTTVGAPVTLN